MAVGQNWTTSSLGGYLANPTLSKAMRHAASPLYIFRQFCKIKEAFGHGKADKVYFDKMSRISTRGGTLTETTTMPETNFTVSQDSITVNEYGNSIPYSEKLQTLSEFNVNDETSVVIRDDMHDVLDRAVATVATAADLLAIVINTATTSFSTNGTINHTAHGNMSDKNVRDIIDYMKIKKIPKYENGSDYISIATVNAQRGLYDYLQALMAYTTPEYMFNQEKGKYYGCRFVEENNVLSNIKGFSANSGEALFLGGDALMEAVAVPEELRMKIPTDYGRSKGVAWYALLGFKKIWDYSTDSEEHELFMTSSV